jgi:hypothetical protein
LFNPLFKGIIACGSGKMFGLALDMLKLVDVELVVVLDKSGEKCIALNAGLSKVGVGVAECEACEPVNECALGRTGRCNL